MKLYLAIAISVLWQLQTCKYYLVLLAQPNASF